MNFGGHKENLQARMEISQQSNISLFVFAVFVDV